MIYKCSECLGTVSDTAACCPHCGAPISIATKRPGTIDGSAKDLRSAMRFPLSQPEEEVAAEKPVEEVVPSVRQQEDEEDLECDVDEKEEVSGSKHIVAIRILLFVIGFVICGTVAVFLNQVFDFIPTRWANEGSRGWPVVCAIMQPLYTAIPFLSLMKIWGEKAVAIMALIIAFFMPIKLAIVLNGVSEACRSLGYKAYDFSWVTIPSCVVCALWTLYFTYGYCQKEESQDFRLARLGSYLFSNAILCVYAYVLWDMFK